LDKKNVVTFWGDLDSIQEFFVLLFVICEMPLLYYYLILVLTTTFMISPISVECIGLT